MKNNTNVFKAAAEAVTALGNEINRRESMTNEYRNTHKRSKIQLINIKTGRVSTLWNVPVDVKAYLSQFSKLKRGALYDEWKRKFSFENFIRHQMKKEGFQL